MTLTDCSCERFPDVLDGQLHIRRQVLDGDDDTASVRYEPITANPKIQQLNHNYRIRQFKKFALAKDYEELLRPF